MWKIDILSLTSRPTYLTIDSDGGLVEFHNQSSVGICWCIRCDFADYNRFTHIPWIKYFLCPGRKLGASIFFPCLCICPCVKGHNWFSYITLCKIYCKSPRRLFVSETSLPCCPVVHINLVIACFVQASDNRLLKLRINHHNQQLFWLIYRLFPIIGTSLVSYIYIYIYYAHLLPKEHKYTHVHWGHYKIFLTRSFLSMSSRCSRDWGTFCSLESSSDDSPAIHSLYTMRFHMLSKALVIPKYGFLQQHKVEEWQNHYPSETCIHFTFG